MTVYAENARNETFSTIPIHKSLIYLEEHDQDFLIENLSELITSVGFSNCEASFEDAATALSYIVNGLSKQGGKVILIMGSELSYPPKKNPKSNLNRNFFYSNDNAFSKQITDMHRSLMAVDLYIFGHKKAKNLASISEM